MSDSALTKMANVNSNNWMSEIIGKPHTAVRFQLQLARFLGVFFQSEDAASEQASRHLIHPALTHNTHCAFPTVLNTDVSTTDKIYIHKSQSGLEQWFSTFF